MWSSREIKVVFVFFWHCPFNIPLNVHLAASFFRFLGLPLKADGQILLFKQAAQFGPTGLQISCPNPTNNQLMSFHSSRGSHSSSCTRVCSGVFAGVLTHPNLPEIR